MRKKVYTLLSSLGDTERLVLLDEKTVNKIVNAIKEKNPCPNCQEFVYKVRVNRAVEIRLHEAMFFDSGHSVPSLKSLDMSYGSPFSLEEKLSFFSKVFTLLFDSLREKVEVKGYSSVPVLVKVVRHKEGEEYYLSGTDGKGNPTVWVRVHEEVKNAA